MHNFGFNPTQFRVQPLYPGLKRILQAVETQEKKAEHQHQLKVAMRSQKEENFNFVGGKIEDLKSVASRDYRA